jgi:AcrR family transcriptional regulator
MARPLARARSPSRTRLLAAATEEFAAHGLAGGSVDRIARKARLNKAMIYYHFASKDALYREILRSTFEAVRAGVDATQTATAPPAERLGAFVDAFLAAALTRPHFPRMMMRELSESGRHLDRRTAEAWIAVPEVFFAILADGIGQGVFRPVHPLLGFLSTVGPAVLLLASRPARGRVARLLGRAFPDVAPADLSAQARAAALAALSVAPSSPPHIEGVAHDLPRSRSPVGDGPRADRHRPRV